MTLAALVNRPIHAYFQGFGQGNRGARVSVANDTTNPVTQALVEQCQWAGNETNYRAGKRFFMIPVVPTAADGSSAGLPQAADLAIWAVVVATSGVTTSTGLPNRNRTVINTYQQGNPNRLTLAHKGCGLICVSPYTGTAPDPTSATVKLNYVCTSATAGSVETPSTDGIADSHGCRVLAVDTVLAYCAYML